jgi:integrase
MSKRVCEWCDEGMYMSNYKRHLLSCAYKNKVGVPKKQISSLLQNNPHPSTEEEVKELKEKVHLLQEKQLQIAHKFKDIYAKVLSLFQAFSFNKFVDMDKYIDEMIISEGTRSNYRTEWKKFKKWLNKNSEEVTIDSVNSYLSSIKCKPSTLLRKRNMLQILLRNLLRDNSIELKRIKLKFSFQQKYTMSNEECKKLLEEQKKNDFEIYLIMKLMISFGLRISSISSLKLHHLHFYFNPSCDTIELPDVKTQKERVEKLDQEFIKELALLLEDRDIEDTTKYLFYPLWKDEFRQRTNRLGTKLNKILDKSEVFFPKDPTKKYTTHMFRRTKANLAIKEEKERLLELANYSIGQVKGSSAIKHYVNIK